MLLSDINSFFSKFLPSSPSGAKTIGTIRVVDDNSTNHGIWYVVYSMEYACKNENSTVYRILYTSYLF